MALMFRSPGRHHIIPGLPQRLQAPRRKRWTRRHNGLCKMEHQSTGNRQERKKMNYKLVLAFTGSQFVEEKIVQTPAILHVKSHLALCNALWTSTKASCAVGCLLHFMQSKNRWWLGFLHASSAKMSHANIQKVLWQHDVFASQQSKKCVGSPNP